MNKFLAFALLAPSFTLNADCDGYSVIESSSNSESVKELIPRDILLGKPDRFCVRMSKDGSKLSYLARNGNKVKLVITSLKDKKNIKEFDVKESVGMFNYKWAYTNKHILIYQDNDGDENDNLMCLNIESGTKTNLTNLKKSKTYIADMSEKYPNKIMICTNERDPKIFDIYSLDIETGQKNLVFKNTDNWADFIMDSDYNVKFVSRILSDGSTEYLKVQNGKYETFLKVPYCDSKNTGLTHLSKDGNTLYGITSVNRDKSAIIEYDLNNGISKILFESDLADSVFTNCSPRNYKPRFAIVDYLKPENVSISAETSEDLKFLKEKFKDEPFSIVSVNLEDSLWLIAYSPVCKSTQYFIYYRNKDKKLEFLFSAKPELDKYKLQSVEPLIVKSRDGLDLVCYLTKAANFDSCKTKKMVLLVHGGPWARDEYIAHPWAQLLSNRGYSVLQVNYRGSTGFGKNFTNAIDRNLEKMNLDLIDAINWAIKNNIADKDKIAIMGGSFGGYSTLAGLTFFPNVFCCGVDFCGPSDWVSTIKSNPPYWAQFAPLEYKTYGNPNNEEDLEYLKKISPLNYCSNICKPLMVVQGTNDPRVTKLESDQIVNQLKCKNKPVAYVLYENEGHSLMLDNNRKTSLAFAEKFLAKILGGFYEPINESEKEGATYKILEGSDFFVD